MVEYTEKYTGTEIVEEIDLQKNTGNAENSSEKSAKPQKPPRKKSGFSYFCYRAVKRAFDIFSSALFLIVFSWLFLILAIVVKCSDGGKIFYGHKRVGKGGKTIYIYKFRSMKKNADKLSIGLKNDYFCRRKQVENLYYSHKIKCTKVKRLCSHPFKARR